MSASNILNQLLRRAEEEEAAPACSTSNDFDGRMGLRVSAIFVILVTSSFGALFPVVAKNNPSMKIPSWAFFFAKYFGSGVIVATAFIHLLAPAVEALGNPCLTGPITEYPWVMGIALMTVFTLFFVELLAMRYATFSGFTNAMAADTEAAAHTHSHDIRDESHFSHSHDHRDPDSSSTSIQEKPIAGEPPTESYSAQLTSLFILEFGVVFHSIFIGMTLAVSGAEFTTLYIVLVFHQMFEGLGLGARLSSCSWPRSRKYTPHVMAAVYGLSTPIAIAVGLGIRQSYPPEGFTTLVVNGVFDSISAGILLYTGLVELMAHEFLFSHALRAAPARKVFAAYLFMVLGAALMALLGKWA
ncbi:membrane zinc transporter [Geopyxis carbonaria]|nr:membrane zinc transporter [Geopyxis carbonaria]